MRLTSSTCVPTVTTRTMKRRDRRLEKAAYTATDEADKFTEQRNAGRPNRQSGKEKENPRVMAKARVKEKEKERSSGEVSAVTAAAKWRTAVTTASTR